MNEEEQIDLTEGDPMAPDGQSPEDFSADEAAASLAFATQIGEGMLMSQEQEMAPQEGEGQEQAEQPLSDQYPQEEPETAPNEEVEGIRQEIGEIKAKIEEALGEEKEEPNLVTKEDLEAFKAELTGTIKKSLE